MNESIPKFKCLDRTKLTGRAGVVCFIYFDEPMTRDEFMPILQGNMVEINGKQVRIKAIGSHACGEGIKQTGVYVFV